MSAARIVGENTQVVCQTSQADMVLVDPTLPRPEELSLSQADLPMDRLPRPHGLPWTQAYVVLCITSLHSCWCLVGGGVSDGVVEWCSGAVVGRVRLTKLQEPASLALRPAPIPHPTSHIPPTQTPHANVKQ